MHNVKTFRLTIGTFGVRHHFASIQNRYNYSDLTVHSIWCSKCLSVKLERYFKATSERGSHLHSGLEVGGSSVGMIEIIFVDMEIFSSSKTNLVQHVNSSNFGMGGFLICVIW